MDSRPFVLSMGSLEPDAWAGGHAQAQNYAPATVGDYMWPARDIGRVGGTAFDVYPGFTRR
jgi:hypothetical protein